MFKHRNLDQVFLSIVNSFGDRVSYFIGFAQSITYNPISVSYYHDGREGETTTTFYYFCYPVDRYNALFQV